MAKNIEVLVIGNADSFKKSLHLAGAEADAFGKKVSTAGNTHLKGFSKNTQTASVHVGSLERSLTSGGHALSGFAKASALAAGAAGVGALFVTLKSGYGEWQNSQKAAAQTEAAIKSTGGAANVTAKQVDGLSKSLMKKSGVDDEAVKSGENMILTFTNIRNEAGKGNDIFNRTSKAVLDMDTAMTHGNVTQENMAKQAILVGKAMNDPIAGLSALHRVGVAFTDQQKEQIKAMVAAGDTMGAQKVILAELNKEFGGSATAMGKTLPGQINILKETFKNLSGEIIGTVMPSVQKLLGGAVEWLNSAKNQKTITDAVTTAMGFLSNAVSTAWRVFKELEPTLKKVADYFITGVKVGIDVATGAFELLAKVFGKHKAEMIVGIVAIGAALTLAIGPEAAAIVGVITAVGFIKSHWDTVKKWFSDFKDWVMDHLIPIMVVAFGPLGFVAAEVIKHWDKLKTWFTDFARDFAELFTHPVAAVKKLFDDLTTGIPGAFKTAWHDAVKSFVDLFGSIHIHWGHVGFLGHGIPYPNGISWAGGSVGGGNGVPSGADVSPVTNPNAAGPINTSVAYTGSLKYTGGRVDEGVDFSQTGNYGAVAAGKITNIIPNWYKGQPLVIEKLTKPITVGGKTYSSVYYAEEPSLVNIGDKIKKGQGIITGGGAELGFADAGGALARGHYNEGDKTPEGYAFLAYLTGKGSTLPKASTLPNTSPPPDASHSSAKAKLSTAQKEIAAAIKKQGGDAQRLEDEFTKWGQSLGGPGGGLSAVVQQNVDAIKTARKKAEIALNIGVAKSVGTAYDQQFAAFNIEISELSKLASYTIPGVVNDYGKNITAAFKQETTDLTAELAQANAKVKSSTGKVKSAWQKVANKLTTDQNSLNQQIEQSLADKVNTLQQAYQTALSKFDTSFGKLVSDIDQQFQQQVADFITNRIGPQFFQNGLQTPLEAQLAGMQTADQQKSMADALANAQKQLATDMADQSNVTQDQIDQDQDAVYQAQRAIDENDLAIRATAERKQADKDYAAAVKKYQEEQTFAQRKLDDSLDTLRTNIENGSASLTDLNPLLDKFGVAMGTDNGLTAYSLDLRAAFGANGGLLSATSSLQGAFAALVDWVNRTTNSNLSVPTPGIDASGQETPTYDPANDPLIQGIISALNTTTSGYGAKSKANLHAAGGTFLAKRGTWLTAHDLVGEAGPELVRISPLSGGSGGGDVYNININGPVYGDDRAVNELTDKVYRSLLQKRNRNAGALL